MDKSLFIKNRNKIFDLMEDNSSFIIFSKKSTKDDIYNIKYNVNRNFYYISGILEYGDIIVLSKKNNKKSEIIFIKPYDELEAKWTGAPFSKEEINKLSGIKDIRYVNIFNKDIMDLLKDIDNVYFDINTETDDINQNQAFVDKILDKYPNINIVNGRELFAKARTIKEPEEIEEIEKAIEITNKGILNILDHMKSMYEYQLESYFDQAIKYFGATGYAFPTIAASGINATCLHYTDNNSKALDGDLILLDLGCSLNMYCSDITRTFPVNGKFSDRQKEIYNIVLNGQKVVFDNIKPGRTTKELNNILIKYYEKELIKIGLIKEPSEVKKYYYHGVSHHIGLDCHDLCEYKELKPGSIISCEPGLYIPEERIGIRIEDDVLVTENGARWLSPQIIKTVDEIEEYIRRNKK